MDALANGRRIKCLTIVDDFTRECLDIAADYGISGGYVARVLEAIGRSGFTRAVRTDQGPEFHQPEPSIAGPTAVGSISS